MPGRRDMSADVIDDHDVDEPAAAIEIFNAHR
jgi:hypothetical protein